MWVYEDSICPRKRPDVSGPVLEETGCYRMVSEPTLVVSRAHVSQLRTHGAYGCCRPRVVTQHGTCASTGHTDVAKRGRFWLGLTDEDMGLLRG
jgi:hypothetical protein